MGITKSAESRVRGWRGRVAGAEVRLWGSAGCGKGLGFYYEHQEKPWEAFEWRRDTI